MKKIVLCAAVSAICAAPMAAMAGADFYGQLRVSLNSVDADNGAGDDGLAVTDNTSVFGFKAKSEGDETSPDDHRVGPRLGEKFLDVFDIRQVLVDGLSQ